MKISNPEVIFYTSLKCPLFQNNYWIPVNYWLSLNTHFILCSGGVMLSETTYTDYTANTNLSINKASPAGKNFLIVLILHLSFFTWQSWLFVNCLTQTYCRYVIVPISISETPNFSHVNFADNNGRWITSSFVFDQNFPIPFNPGSKIKFKINKWNLFLST